MKKSIAAVFVAVGVAGCGAADPDLTCDTKAATVTLEANVQAVFDAKCTKECHLARDTYGDFTTAAKTAAATVGKKSLFAGSIGTLRVVDPSKLENSSLWLKVLGGQAKARRGPKGENVLGVMPNDGTTLTASEKQLLKDWICTGGN